MTPPSADPLAHALHALADGRHLSAAESEAAFDRLMAGAATPAQIAGLLVGLRVLGESSGEIAGAATALRRAMVRLPGPAGPGSTHAAGLVDTCGTGGGGVTTFNISTAAALVAAGAGVPIAKHGNRSYTSRSGSADLFEALGVGIDIEPGHAARVLAEAGIAFLYAPTYHPAMRHAATVRRELGVPTVMNLIGPLGNPAGARRQVLGVADRSRAPLLAEALAALGVDHALVVHGDAGLDEVSPLGPTSVWEVRGTVVTSWALEPERFGVGRVAAAALGGGSPAENAGRVERLLGGAEDPAARSAVLLNAAAAIYVAEGERTLEESFATAARSLDEGAAAERLRRLRVASTG